MANVDKHMPGPVVTFPNVCNSAIEVDVIPEPEMIAVIIKILKILSGRQKVTSILTSEVGERGKLARGNKLQYRSVPQVMLL